jgi:hypothetical protein
VERGGEAIDVATQISSPAIARVAPLVAALWIAQGAFAAVAIPDADRLRALHEKVMQAHRHGNVELLLEDEAADYVVANRGEVTRPTLDDRRRRLGGYLSRTSFREYRDVIEPVVTVSNDGTLAWVIVQVKASGTQTTDAGQKEPIEFVSAWIELYQKKDGRWWRVGNVSNFKP